MKRHIYADLINAYADGAEIESWNGERWVVDRTPCFLPELRYRIKPHKVKRDGWVNIYPMNGCPSDFIASTGHVFSSYEAAIECDRENKRLATVKIEWEEER